MENCKNCEQPAEGNFCSHCGQKTHIHRDSFLHLIGHFIADYFHYDNKFLNTVKALILSPGKITYDYLRGKRATYLNPIQIFIFTSALFFLVFFSTFHVNLHSEGRNMQTQMTFGFSPPSEGFQEIDTTYMYEGVRLGSQEDLNATIKERRVTPISITSLEDLLNYPIFFISDFAFHHNYYNIGVALEHVYEIFAHGLSKMFLLLTPLLALLLLLFFRKKGFLYIDHLIASIHLQVFIFLSFTMMFIILIFVREGYLLRTINIFLFLQLLYLILFCRKLYAKSWFYSIVGSTLTYGLYLFFIFGGAYLNLIRVMRWG